MIKIVKTLDHPMLQKLLHELYVLRMCLAQLIRLKTQCQPSNLFKQDIPKIQKMY